MDTETRIEAVFGPRVAAHGRDIAAATEEQDWWNKIVANAPVDDDLAPEVSAAVVLMRAYPAHVSAVRAADTLVYLLAAGLPIACDDVCALTGAPESVADRAALSLVVSGVLSVHCPVFDIATYAPGPSWETVTPNHVARCLGRRRPG